MSILSRLQDLAAANFGDLIDHAENPQKMIGLAVARMEAALIDARGSATRTLAERAELNRAIEQLKRSSSDWQNKSRLALDVGRDDLARASLAESEKGVPQLAQLESDVAELDRVLELIGADITKLNTALADARTREGVLQARGQVATSRASLRAAFDPANTSLVNNGLDHLERQVDWAEAEAASYDVGSKIGSEAEGSWDSELTARVDARFAELVAQRNSKAPTV